jgi:hypothetical protein
LTAMRLFFSISDEMNHITVGAAFDLGAIPRPSPLVHWQMPQSRAASHSIHHRSVGSAGTNA